MKLIQRELSEIIILFIAAAAHAATITWTGPTTISGSTDVNTNGVSVFAYTGGTAATVNGVPFTASFVASLNNHYLQLNGLSSYSVNAFTTASNNFASLSAEYKNILIGGAYENAGAVTTNTLNSLVVGRNYTVQIWINDPRSGTSTNRYAVVNTSGPEIHYNDTHAEGGVGAYAVGTFTADSSTQSFILDGDVSTQLNAIQLRVESVAVLPALYWDANSDTAGFGTAGGSWGTDTSWSTNAFGSTLPDQPISTTYSNVVHFGTTNNGLAAGYINVTSTQSFDTLSFGLANSGPIAITNGTLGFTAPASTIILNTTTNTISSLLAPGGSLAIRSVKSIYCNKFPTTTEAILFTNATLAHYVGVDATMGGSSINFGSTTPTEATAYFWTNDGTNASFQVQTYDAGHTKVVKVALRQSGSNIVGRALYAKHCSPDGNILGTNFDVGQTTAFVATWFNVSNYGVAEMTLDRSLQYRFGSFLTTTPQMIATNVTLSSIENIEASLAGGWVVNDFLPASIFHLMKTETNATFQAQLLDGGYTKCVKVELLPLGNAIQARTVYAKNLTGDYLGYNFDMGGTSSTLATSIAGDGYGIRTMSMNTSQPTLIFSADSAFNSITTITGATLSLEGRLGNGDLSGGIVNNGKLELRPSAQQTLSGPISGTGLLVANLQPGLLITYAPALTTSYTTIAANKTLANYTNASGYLSGAYVTGAPAATTPYFFTNDGTTATVQFQVYNGAHTKCVKAEFKQVGADIQAKVLYSKHCSPDGNNVGTNYDPIGAAYSYDLVNIALYPAAPVGRVVLSGNNTYRGGTVLNSGELEITTAASLPALGGIVVNGGNLLLNVPWIGDGASAAGGLNNSLTVSAAGMVTLASQFNAGHSRPIILDGGILYCSNGSLADGVNYVCNLTLKNGARVTGNSLRTGYHSTPTYRIQGTSPSTIEAGLIAVYKTENPNWYLEVDNVTGDDTTDLTISGSIANYSNWAPMTIYKRNAGTLSLSGNNSSYTGPVYIEAGSIRLDSVNALTAANAVNITNGALVSTTFSNRIGNVSLNTGSIRMGTDKLIAGTATLAGNTEIHINSGSLAFASSSAITWTAGKTLNIVGTLGRRSIRFGTTSSGLTSTQLQMITLNGKTTRFILDENGYLVELRGTVIQFM